ncbi:MAG: translation elongation factor Ts [Gemmatales bacterium]|nr:translation elongation factor Ts [Gemmatales bacterium]MDW7993056.1 translation elongation factor Ts [Gemmatales bacterium]
MATITAADVMKLRSLTNAPMMDCKAALEKANGDFEKAIQILREQSKVISSKKAGRETAEGRIGIYLDQQRGVAAIVEMRCETAPVAKSDPFIQLTEDLARHVALTPELPQTVEELLQQPYVDGGGRTVRERIEETIGIIRENMRLARFARLSGGTVGGYLHFNASTGTILLAEGTPKDPTVLQDIAMHITGMQPLALTRDEIPADVMERERQIARAQAEQTGKPAHVLEKIVEGKLRNWLSENVLLEQKFIKDDSKTVGQLAQEQGITIQRFIRFKVGELTS